MKSSLRSRWPLLFSIITSALFISYYFYSAAVYPETRAGFVIVYGILCAAAMLFLTLYVLRENIYRYRLGSRNEWLQAHTYIGIISIVIIFMHFSFKPTGAFSIFLSVLFFLTILSGIAGSIIYRTIPPALSKYGRPVKTDDELIHNIDSLINEAAAVVTNASAEFKAVYEKKIRDLMEATGTRWGYLLLEEKELLNKRRMLIEGCRDNVHPVDIHDLEILGSILIEKEKNSFMQAKLKLQKAWLTLHMPLSLALLTAAVIHVITVIYY